MNNLTNALLITAIGMGLVFLSLVVLWGLMALIIRVFPERSTPEAGAAEPEVGTAPVEMVADAEPAPKRRAAAIAVALALHLASSAAQSAAQIARPQDSSQLPAVSAWQSVMRSNMLNKRGPRGPKR